MPAPQGMTRQDLDARWARLDQWEADLTRREKGLRAKKDDEGDEPDDSADNDNGDDDETDDNGRPRKRNKKDDQDQEDEETRAILSGHRRPGSIRSAAKAITRAAARMRAPIDARPFFGPPQPVRRTPQTNEERQTLALRIINAGRRARNQMPLRQLGENA